MCLCSVAFERRVNLTAVLLCLHQCLHCFKANSRMRVIQGVNDEVVNPNAVQKLVDKLRTQRHITIHHDEIPRANHFFENEMELLMASVNGYLDFRLDPNCPIK